jgi:hypothetical protein
MTNDCCDTVVFDRGAVLIDWAPRHLYRTLFHSDHAASGSCRRSAHPPGIGSKMPAVPGPTRLRCFKISSRNMVS